VTGGGGSSTFERGRVAIKVLSWSLSGSTSDQSGRPASITSGGSSASDSGRLLDRSRSRSRETNGSSPGFVSGTIVVMGRSVRSLLRVELSPLVCFSSVAASLSEVELAVLGDAPREADGGVLSLSFVPTVEGRGCWCFFGWRRGAVGGGSIGFNILVFLAGGDSFDAEFDLAG